MIEITFISSIHYLEGGDGDPILPVIEVADRPVYGEPKTHKGDEGPKKSVGQGTRPGEDIAHSVNSGCLGVLAHCGGNAAFLTHS